MGTHTQPSPTSATVLTVKHVIPVRPLHWLRLGWADFMRHPGPGLLHGFAVALGGWIVLSIGSRHWTLLAGSFSGFVLMGPILATGLYELSRLDALGRSSGLNDAVGAWRRGTRPLVYLGMLLGLAGTLWVFFSATLFHLLAPQRLSNAIDFLRYAVVGQSTFLFVLWTMMGGIGAAIVFAATAVSPPLLLARKVDLRTAILTSVRAVGENPVAMGLWATLIMIFTFVSLLTFMLGFVVVIPVIGHATWHAYTDLVDTAGVPER
jgi:uncharacterized membrane protein